MDLDDLKEILKVYREEVREISTRMTADLLAMEAPEATPGPLLDRLFRDAHTIKGGAGSLGLDEVSQLAHVGESILGACKRGERAFDVASTDAFLAMLDAIGNRLDMRLAGREDDGLDGIEKARAALEKIAGGVVAAAKKKPKASPAAEPAASLQPDGGVPDTVVETASIKVGAERLETLSSSVDEFLLARLRVGQRAAEAVRLGRALESLARRAAMAAAGADPGRDPIGELKSAAREVTALGWELGRDKAYLGSLSDDLRESIRSLQIIPASTVLEGFRRSVRDHAKRVGIDTGLDLLGGDVAADRRILEALHGPISHLLRNAVDHGLEKPAERKKAGKSERGRITLEVRIIQSKLEVTVSDDGRGLDPEKLRASAVEKGMATAQEAITMSDPQAIALIWRPGFSTARSITETSGRGVGLDAVRDTLVRLGGRVEVDSALGFGTTFKLTVPLMLSAALGMLVEAAGIRYLLPITAVEEIRRLTPEMVRSARGALVVEHGSRAIPLVPLVAALTGQPTPVREEDRRALACVVSDGAQEVALLVDRVLGETEMSVRPLSPELARYDHLAGATRTGDGQVLLVLAVSGVVRRAVEISRAGTETLAGEARTVLVVDDAVTSRLLYRSVFEEAGWRVVLAADGEEALEIARARKLDAIVSDVRMPRMDGLELTRRVRRLDGMRELPIVLCSSLASDDDRREGVSAGATVYLVKGETPPAKVVDVLGSFVS